MEWIDAQSQLAHQMAMQTMPATNRVQRLLDKLRIDWRSSRERLNAANRIVHDGRTGREVLPIADECNLGRMAGPLHTDASIAHPYHLPPAMIEGDLFTRFGYPWNRAGRALGQASRLIARDLDQPLVVRSQGRLEHRWTDLSGSISLITGWSAVGTRFGESIVGDADLCRLTIVPGWRLPLSSEDRAVIARMDIIGRGTRRGVDAFMTSAATNADIGHVRDPDMFPDDLEDLDGAIGFDRRTETVIGCNGRLVMASLSEIEEITHHIHDDATRTGSTIAVTIPNGESIEIAHHDDPNGLTLVARALAKASGRKVPITRMAG